MDKTDKQYLYNDGMGDGGVDFFIINLISLFIAFYNLSCLISNQSSLKVFFDLIDPFILENFSCIWPRNQILSLIFYQIIIFFLHNLLSECGICRIYNPFINYGLSIYLFRGHIITFYHKYEALSL